MATATATAKATPALPSETSLAFAIAVVRSKPPELSIREYIHLLRRHVAKGRRENAISCAFRHLDRSAFWRAECERLRAEARAGEEREGVLEREVAGLKGEIEDLRAVGRKRKGKRGLFAPLPPPVPPQLDLKGRLALASSGLGLRGGGWRDGGGLRGGGDDDELDFSRFGDGGDLLIRSLFKVGVECSKSPEIDTSAVAYHAAKAAGTIPQIVIQAAEQELSSVDGSGVGQKNGFRSVLQQLAKGIGILFDTMGDLVGLSNPAKFTGQVTYACVHMYADLLGLLTRLASTCSKPSASAASVVKPRSKKRTRQTVATDKSRATELDLLTSFLCGIVIMLDHNQSLHRQLFEGFAFVVLERLGTTLYSLVFEQARGSNIREEIAASHKRPDTEQAPRPEDTCQRKTSALETARAESPSLLRLLRCIMQAAPAHMNGEETDGSKRAERLGDDTTRPGLLAVEATKRLQRTLVNCIFGTEGTKWAKNHPSDWLQMPETSAALASSTIRSGKEDDVREWFTEEVWRLLGWDILAGVED